MRAQIATLAWVATSLLAGHAWAASALTGLTPVAAQLRHSTQELLDAVAPGNVAVWDRLLADQAIQVDENDLVHTKQDILAALTPLGAGLEGHLTIDDFRVVEHADTAVVTHEDAEFLNYHGQIIRSRFRMTDTWVHSEAGWRLLASQVLAVLQDPPVHKLAAKTLCGYAGAYELTPDIKGTMRCDNDELLFERPGRPVRHYRPELLDLFFEPGEPRTRRIFMRDAQGVITGFVDRREARDIAWRKTDAAK